MRKRWHSEHGADVTFNVCPQCFNEKMAKQQHRLDRARFARQMREIRGKQ